MTLNISGPICTHSGIINGELKLNQSSVVLLSGENGIGKSTVVQFIKLNENLRKEFRISFSDQFPLTSLNEMTVSNLIGNLKVDFSNFQIKSVLDKVYQRFFDEKILSKSINQLSGGENQLLKLLICLGMESDFYVLDEPTTFLDEEKLVHFIEIVKELKQNGKGFLIVEHRKDQIAKIVDSVIQIKKDEKGELVFYGK